MQKIGELLKRFTKICRPDILIREKTSEILKEEIGINIEPKRIKVKNGIILLELNSAAARNELFIKKDRILRKIKEQSKDVNIRDIK